jgi:hypothetical protein
MVVTASGHQSSSSGSSSSTASMAAIKLASFAFSTSAADGPPKHRNPVPDLLVAAHSPKRLM